MKSKRRLSVLVILAVMVAMLASMSVFAAVKINKTKATVEVGKTVTLKITGAKKGAKITWSTSKKAVATVTSKGVVKGVKAGTAKITAKVDKKKYTCTVTVKAASKDKTVIADVSIEPLAEAIDLGETVQLVLHSDDKVTWKSSNAAVATVTNKGVVTGLKEGSAIITATSTKDATQFGWVEVSVRRGKVIKNDNYTNYLNFEMKAVPIRRYSLGRYRTDPADGKLKLGKWEQEVDPITFEWKWVYKGEMRELDAFGVEYYIVPDAQTLQKSIDWIRTNCNFDFSYLVAPRTILTIDTKNWNSPSFDVTGVRTRRDDYSVNSFDYTDYKNGQITDDDGDPIFNPHEGTYAYEFVYPDDVVANRIFGSVFTSRWSYDESWKAVDGSELLKECLFLDLIDTKSFSIYNISGMFITK